MIRHSVSHALHSSGFLSLWRRLHKERITCLTIHSVLDDTELDGWRPLRNFLPLRRLQQNLQFLQQRNNFISLAQALDILEGSAPPVPNAIVLTFDDGYMNNFTLALPVLKAMRIPATFFIVTNRVETRTPFWFDRVDFALQNNIAGRHRLRVCGKTIQVEDNSRVALRRAMLDTFALLMSAGHNDRDLDQRVDEVLAPVEALRGMRLADYYDADSPCAIVTKPVLSQAARSELVTLGSHTHHHVRLTTMPDIDVTEELQRSAEWLTALTGKPADQFCYPNGSFDARTAKLVQAAGYRTALTCIEGQNSSSRFDPMAVRRINWAHDATPVELLALSCGAYRDVPGMRAKELVDESGPPVRAGGIAVASID